MSGFMEFDLGNTEKAIKKPVTNFKVEDGKSYRVSLAWWAPIGDSTKFDFESNALDYFFEVYTFVMHEDWMDITCRKWNVE